MENDNDNIINENKTPDNDAESKTINKLELKIINQNLNTY